MNLNDAQFRLLAGSWALHKVGAGLVLEAEYEPVARELARHGWLAEELLENGDTAWFWTQQAETALNLTKLVVDAEGRTN
jgi:hypothetical protein